MNQHDIERIILRNSFIDVLIKLYQFIKMRFELFILSFFKVYKYNDITLPKFLCIGTQKAGTTYLYTLLKNSAEFSMPETKEIHYFDRGRGLSFKKYLNVFNSFELDSGDITPNYCVLSPVIIKQIKILLPKVKIILITRNPIDRAWSATKMELGFENNRSIRNVSNSSLIKCMLSKRVTALSDYNRQLNNWLKYFDTSDVLILDFDELKAEPLRTMNEIRHFLGKQIFKDGEYIRKEPIFKGESFNMPNEVSVAVQEKYTEITDNARTKLLDCGVKVKW